MRNASAGRGRGAPPGCPPHTGPDGGQFSGDAAGKLKRKGRAAFLRHAQGHVWGYFLIAKNFRSRRGNPLGGLSGFPWGGCSPCCAAGPSWPESAGHWWRAAHRARPGRRRASGCPGSPESAGRGWWRRGPAGRRRP